MEKLCRNCRYFEPKGLNDGTQIWGICVKPKSGDLEAKARKRGNVFQWGDAGCVDFKAKEESVEHHKPAESPLN
jgi:hypothetical protein